MRRGYRPEWDNTERAVWTAFAFAWAVLLGWWLLLYILGATALVPSAVHRFLPQWSWETLLLAHALTFALMWLRKMLQKPTGKERDR